MLADKQGVVDMTAAAIARRTTIPLDIIERGIDALLLPDEESRTPTENGRRILPLSESRSWGWKITNYEHYRQLHREEDRRDYQRQYWHKRKSTVADDAENSTDSTDSTSLNILNSTQQTQPNQPIAYANANAVNKTHAKRAGADRAPSLGATARCCAPILKKPEIQCRCMHWLGRFNHSPNPLAWFVRCGVGAPNFTRYPARWTWKG